MQIRAEWTFRLTVEQFVWPYTSFLTLTYNEESLPYVSGSPSLYKPHIEKFVKDLRNDGLNFKYYMVGEYGGKFHRPHYHYILYHDEVVYPSMYWHFGNVHEYKAQIGGLHYVGKHHIVVKDKNSPLYEPVEPFSRQSKGLGSSYLDQFVDQRTGEIYDVPFSIDFHNYHYPFPRYYRKKLVMPSDSDFTFALDHIERKYPNFSHSQHLEILKQLQFASKQKIEDYNNQIR